MNKIAIILPVYNGQGTVKDCILSIKNQTFKDFECVIVDDGSTDDTLEIAKNTVGDDRRFRIISKEHEGLSVARNVGIENSAAPIIMYIDADDTALSKMMEKVVPFMENHNLDMMFFDAQSINLNNTDDRAKGEKRYFTRSKDYGISSGKEMLKTMIENGDFVYAVFLQAIKRECLKYKYYPGMRAQDHLYTIENLYLANRVGHLHEILYQKSCRKESVTYTKKDENYAWSRIQTIRELAKYIENEKVEDKKLFFRIIDRILRQIPFFRKSVSPADFDWLMESDYMKENFSYIKKIIKR